MSEELPPFAVDTRGTDVLVYKLGSDKWGKPYYTPSSLEPLHRDDARALALALLAVTAPPRPTL